MRRALPFCGLWLVACAAPLHEAAPASAARDAPISPFFDAAEEWAADHPQPPPLPRRPPRPRARPEPVERWVEPESDFELARLSPDQRVRIARVQPIVHLAARTHALPPDLVNGVIWVESQFQVQARSRSGAHGLMQLMPATGREVARELGRRYLPFDPEFNIHAGAYYLSRMLDRFQGDLRLALAAYNTGPAVIEGCLRGNRPLPSYSERYVDHVFNAARAFRALEL